jgi:hypothetical protein
MDSHWVNDRPGYRCRHGYSSSRTRPLDAPRNLYVSEDVLLTRLVRDLVPDRCRSDGVVEPGLVAEVVVRLQDESKVIICGTSDWTIAATE